jgi:transcriptional regulator with XRE-family HTH domain
MLFDLKETRLNYRLSQVKLSHESGVSLPTIQNIEAGKANPTVEVLERLLSSFGLQFQVAIPEFDSERASAFGVPLVAYSSKSVVLVNKDTLRIETRKWHQLLLVKKLPEREVVSVIAFLKGLKEHYYQYYEKEIATPLFDQMIEAHSGDGRVIKLRRIALANMSQYL